MARVKDVTDVETGERVIVPFTPEEEAARDAEEAKAPPVTPAPRDIFGELDALRADVNAIKAKLGM
jgi:hypothetical protein